MTYLLLCIGLFAGLSFQGYVEPALTLPPTPNLPLAHANHVGYVNINHDVDIWYARWGPIPSYDDGSEEPPILFLHGELANSDWWGDQVTFLVDKYPKRTIIAMDSGMQGVIDHLDIAKVTLVGWSDGGIIGQELLVNHPTRVERVFDFAGQIVSNDTAADAESAPTIVEFIPRAYAEFIDLSPSPSELHVTIAKVSALKSNFTEAEFAGIPTLFDDCASAPLVWFVDAADEELVTNGTARQMADWVRGSGLMLLPSVSHFSMIQDPDTFNVVLDRFLIYEVKCNETRRL